MSENIQDVAQAIRDGWHVSSDDEVELEHGHYMVNKLGDYQWDEGERSFHGVDDGHVSKFVDTLAEMEAQWEARIEPVITEAELSMQSGQWIDEFGYSWVPVDQDIMVDVPECCEHDTWGSSVRKMRRAYQRTIEQLIDLDRGDWVDSDDYRDLKQGNQKIFALESKAQRLASRIDTMSGMDSRILRW